MAVESFDDFRATEVLDQYAEMKPFQFRDNPGDDKKTLEWLKQNFDTCYRMSLSRMITYRRYHALYKGIHWRFQDTRRTDRDVEYTRRKPRQVVNQIFDMVDGRVAQSARFKSNIQVIPVHDEQDDINDAEYAKMAYDARAEEIELNLMHQAADRIMYTFGDVFFWVVWNADIGPEYPPYAKLKERYPDKMPKRAKKFLKDKPLRVGDVEVFITGPDRVFPERFKKKWKDVNHIDLIEWADINELKADYPEHAGEILENQREYFDFDINEISTPKGQVMVRCFYHKKTKHLPDGAYIKYTDDVILEQGPYPYEEDDLPFEHDGDLEMYDELWSRSFISQIEQMQRMYNNIQSGIARDFGVGSAPKWMMPKGSASISTLNNEFTIVEFSGPVAPQLVNNIPVSNKSFEVQDRLEKKISQMSRLYDISRGEVPAGVTANAALRFLDEQESQRSLPQEVKRKRRVVRVAKKILKRMQQFYQPEDGRTAKMLGPNNEYLMESFESANLKNAYDIRLENSPDLPDTKVGKIAAIIDLNSTTQNDPIFRREEVIQMLDLGLDDAFKDGAMVAVNAAKTILSMILKGKPVPEPQPFDKNLVHYLIFDRFMQSTTFKTSVKPETKAIIQQRMLTMEMLMFDMATKNQKFLSQLMQIDCFPMFFTCPMPLYKLAQIQQVPPAPPSQATPKVGADTGKVETINQTEGA